MSDDGFSSSGVLDRAYQDNPATSTGRKYPIVEIFGPTVQGEGALAGHLTQFVRLGGCDYKCLWCDSSHAVLPVEVRNAEKLTIDEILGRVRDLPGAPEWVTISGGNPALHDLGELVNGLHRFRFKVAVETQGSVWRDWLADVDMLTVSPKPPSSGMASKQALDELEKFSLKWLNRFYDVLGRQLFRYNEKTQQMVLKVPIWDEADYLWAKALHSRWHTFPFYLSVVTAMGGLYGDFDGGRKDTKEQILKRWLWLVERAAGDPAMGDVTIFCQLHTLLWHHDRGH